MDTTIPNADADRYDADTEGLSRRQIQIGLRLREIAQDFFQRESSGLSLITVTRARVSPDMKYATIFITTLPESKEASALDFAKRMRTDLKHKFMKGLQTKVTPFVEIEIDFGEKNRQHIERLLREGKKGNKIEERPKEDSN